MALLSQIELRHLRYFVAVATQGSFRAAALTLHLSQPPLTRQIHQLEDILGVQLFQRLPRGVELTDAGTELLREARNILTLTEQAATRAQLAGQGQLGRLDVGVFGSAILGVIPRIVMAFRQQYPRVDVVLHTMDREEQMRALRERRITVGFNRFFPEVLDLVWEPVHTERMLVAIHERHPLSRRSALKLTQLKDEPMVLYPLPSRHGRGFNERTRQMFQDRGATPRVVQEVEDVVTAVAMVSSGFGYCLLVESAAALQLPGVRYLPLEKEDAAAFTLHMIHRRDDPARLLAAFIEVVRSITLKT